MDLLTFDALRFAARKHRLQLRSAPTGATPIPYIDHILHVVGLLVEQGLDGPVLIIGALHDTLEDTDTSYEELEGAFGTYVALAVQRLSLPREINEAKDPIAKRDYQIGSTHGMYVPELLVKLADKLSNSESLITQPPRWGRKAILGYSQNAVEVGRACLRRLHADDISALDHQKDAAAALFSALASRHGKVIHLYGE
jgi:(p)ppGpp synthase/HD superfamily hydrolase